ncbi:conserved Plasmodium protein, unknown function [Plasmodium gallinaceum]|uniref:Uncharacterized protein n=1 Tax=Plasmodium gallinaceum TaxID=5849 RepID=A0A1J1GUH9_PLAGA|nr:conserved Plasmodium protein, unknown function [Plasmodium gallinaceum]CRG94705.1 conserved Plasmodium protein, unknown function [Plasmodium gallinaceum]
MFSLIKSIFSNIQKKEELKILIIGECGSGKTSLFNLISSYDNKSKSDILNTEILKNHDHVNCALGFNTKSIIFNKKNLKIYDLEGTETNTINIYDCYYDDSDIIFYVIDSRSEKHIFKTIVYLSYLYRKCVNVKNNNKNRNEKFFKPTIILGNKSEDGTSFFSAPCIYNYIKTINVNKNEKFWNFILSSDNIFLNYYLDILYERVVEYFLIKNYPFSKFLIKEETDQNLYSEIIRKSNNIIDNIKKNKCYITLEEVESNELLTIIMKNIIDDNINNYKNMPIEVYNISVLQNKGICEVIEIMFEKYFKKENHNNLNNIHLINNEDDNKIMQNVDDNVAYRNNENEERRTRKPFYHYEKSKYDTILDTNNICNSKNVFYNGNKNDKINKLVYSCYPSNPINNYISGKNYLFTNNVYKKRIYKKKEKYSNTQKDNYIMYASNNNSINLFIDYIQHLYFGKDYYENIFNNFSFTFNKNVKNKKRLKFFRRNKKKNNINGFKLHSFKKNNNSSVKIELQRNTNVNEKKIMNKKEYNETKSLIEELKEVEEKDYKVKSDIYKEKTIEENIKSKISKKTEEDLECKEKKEDKIREDEHKEEKQEVFYEEDKESKEFKRKEMDQQIQIESEEIQEKSEGIKNENKKKQENQNEEKEKELNKQIDVKKKKQKDTDNKENHEDKEMEEEKINENINDEKDKCENIHEIYKLSSDKKYNEFKNNSDCFISENYLRSISNLSSISLLDSDTILKLAEKGEDSCKNISKKMSQSFFQKNKEESFILTKLQSNKYCQNIEQNRKRQECEIKETVYREDKDEQKQVEKGVEKNEVEYEEEQKQVEKGVEKNEIKYEEEEKQVEKGVEQKEIEYEEEQKQVEKEVEQKENKEKKHPTQEKVEYEEKHEKQEESTEKKQKKKKKVIEQKEENKEEKQRKQGDIEYEEEKKVEEKMKNIFKKNDSMYKKMREENYTNNNGDTCSYNKKEQEKDSFYKERNLNNVKCDKINYIYKGKINKKRYSLIKKKAKKKFLHNIKLNNLEENSSSSIEDVNLMNIMCIDSLHKI